MSRTESERLLQYRREERRLAVTEAAARAREDGRGIDTGLSSDYTLPEGQQRGRNSRTVPQKRVD